MEEVQKDSFNVIGIVTTVNPGKGPGEIFELWKRFFDENVMGNIPNRVDTNFLGVYFNYEGDKDKPFSLLVGCRVKDLSDIPEGMIGKEVPSAKYQLFRGEGEMPQIVADTWKRVWEECNNRAYAIDFEEYSPEEQKRVDIFISVK